MTDHDRISRLEALLARVKARTEEPRVELNGATHDAADEIVEPLPRHREANSTMEERIAEQLAEQNNGLSRPDSVFPVESSTLHALPPPPPGSSAQAFVAPSSVPEITEEPISSPILTPPPRPVSQPVSKPASIPNGSPASLEEAFEQYELVQEVVEIAADTDDDAVRPSVRPPIMLDEAIEEEAAAAAAVLANERLQAEFGGEAPIEELQSQQRLVVAPSSRPVSGVDESELEVLGEADLQDDVMDVDTDDLLARASQSDVAMVGRATRPAEEMMSAILASGMDPPPENANRPVLELQEDDDEPPPSSRRPVSHELPAGAAEAHEQELTFDDAPPPLMTPPPESGRQVALPDLSPDSSSAFEAGFSGSREGASFSPDVLRADIDDNSGVAVVVAPSAPAALTTFGDLIDLALSI